jgi:hypothetical protein
LGKTEIEINAVAGMVSWDTRYRWLADPKFSARRLEAQAQGVELTLVAHEERSLHAYDKTLGAARTNLRSPSRRRATRPLLGLEAEPQRLL